MAFETFEDVVEFAAGKEAEAVQFYTELSQQEAYAAGKKIFLAFAEEEKKHKAMFENLDLASVAGYKMKAVSDLRRSDYLVDIEYKPGMSYRDILRLAMKREEKAKKFYEDCVDQFDGEKKRLFQVLAQEEAGHKGKLEKMFDDLMAAKGD